MIRTEASSSIPYQDVFFATDVNGLIVNRYEQYDPGTVGGNPLPVTHTYRFGGKEMGLVTNNSTTNIDYATLIDRRDDTPGTGYFLGGATSGTPYASFDANHITLAGGAQDDTPGSWTVHAGDTLQSIATAVWGDASQWYRIAQANGASEAGLAEGQVLVIPGAIGNIHNNAATLKPYDPAKALGDVSPPAAKPPKQQNCGIFGMILLAIIAIGVAALLGPAIIGAGRSAGSRGDGDGVSLLFWARSAARSSGAESRARAGSIVSQDVRRADRHPGQLQLEGGRTGSAWGGAVGGGLRAGARPRRRPPTQRRLPVTRCPPWTRSGVSLAEAGL